MNAIQETLGWFMIRVKGIYDCTRERERERVKFSLNLNGCMWVAFSNVVFNKLIKTDTRFAIKFRTSDHILISPFRIARLFSSFRFLNIQSTRANMSQTGNSNPLQCKSKNVKKIFEGEI